MEIQCDKCKKTYKIDESKLPKKGKVFVKCASCQNKIQLNLTNGTENAYPDTHLTERGSTHDKLAEEPSVEYLDPNTPKALIYCGEIQARAEMIKRLEELGFQVREIKNTQEIRHHFKYNIFDLVILYQQGPDPDQELVSILDYIHNMASSMRRSTLVLYIHLSGNKYDFYDAFIRGVDATLSPMDINHFNQIVPEILQRKQQTYKVFMDCQTQVEQRLT